MHLGIGRTGLVALAALALPLAACSAAGPAASRGDARHATAQQLTAATTAAACKVPASVTAKQVVVVRSSGTRARVTACTRTAAGAYTASLGPFDGRVGRSGVAAAGSVKREGDGRTPRGNFPLRGGFGTAADPGLAVHWMRVTRNDVWVDDPRSTLYNTHQVLPARGRWRSAEKLYLAAYEYAQVIGYNEARTPGRGSAIFLHVDTGRATAGCVSLPRAALLRVLRWQRPGAVMTIS